MSGLQTSLDKAIDSGLLYVRSDYNNLMEWMNTVRQFDTYIFVDQATHIAGHQNAVVTVFDNLRELIITPISKLTRDELHFMNRCYQLLCLGTKNRTVDLIQLKQALNKRQQSLLGSFIAPGHTVSGHSKLVRGDELRFLQVERRIPAIEDQRLNFFR
ncbi:hypothetical protein [Reinekea sp. G2M2-21]|uniref:hypothetical protein n=1 Tax=Reinekea sp. G2M2-21 TaxID=2788942 RepID=UPI0018A9FB30|nr:hypothetical protein [Reinekea sp. G2M2-21]